MPYVNLVITMVLGGLWHGVTWTFAIWGLLHGVGAGGHARLVGVARTPRGRQPARGATPVGPGTYQFVCLTWVFFRAASLPDALAILGRIASLTAGFENVSGQLAAALLLAAAALFLRQGMVRARHGGVRASPVLCAGGGAGAGGGGPPSCWAGAATCRSCIRGSEP